MITLVEVDRKRSIREADVSCNLTTELLRAFCVDGILISRLDCEFDFGLHHQYIKQ
jgi:hypothetical protein